MPVTVLTPLLRCLGTTGLLDFFEPRNLLYKGIFMRIACLAALSVNVCLLPLGAQVTAVSQTILRQLPPGALPPLVINYSASSVPILQLGLKIGRAHV